MAKNCYICNGNVPKTRSIFRIPDRNDEFSERGSLWLKILDADAGSMDQIRVCSDHFLKKKPAKKEDFLNIDWLPNQELKRFSKNAKYITEYFKRKKATLPEEFLRKVQINNYHGQPKNSSDIFSNDETTIDKVDPFVVAGQDAVEMAEVVKLINDIDVAPPIIVQEVCNHSTPNLNPTNSTQTWTVASAHSPELVNALILPPLKKRKIEIIKQQFFLHKEIQTDLTASDIDAMLRYFKNAVEERKEMLFKISTLAIDVDFFKGNDKKTRFYTGFTTWSLLNNFFELVKDYIPNHFNSKLSPFQILVLTLMKLRLNFNFTDLGYRFQVDRTTIAKNFERCIFILFQLLYNSKIIRWPRREDIVLNTPSYFRSAFKEKIVIIIDCFEIFIERASVLRALAQSFSSYKHHTTIKYLIGITTTGVIIFISDAFGGRASDKFIAMKSALLDYLQEGDLVLSDKGFLIKDEVEATGASLKMPSFVRNGNQLHPTEIEESRHIASIRIHVERVISTLRQKFNICSDIAPMSAISKKNDLFDGDLYNKIVFICCSIINLCPSVVSNDFEI